MEELEPPWAAGTFVADIFLGRPAADTPKYSDFLSLTFQMRRFFFFLGKGGRNRLPLPGFVV